MQEGSAGRFVPEPGRMSHTGFAGVHGFKSGRSTYLENKHFEDVLKFTTPNAHDSKRRELVLEDEEEHEEDEEDAVLHRGAFEIIGGNESYLKDMYDESLERENPFDTSKERIAPPEDFRARVKEQVADEGSAEHVKVVEEVAVGEARTASGSAGKVSGGRASGSGGRAEGLNVGDLSTISPKKDFCISFMSNEIEGAGIGNSSKTSNRYHHAEEEEDGRGVQHEHLGEGLELKDRSGLKLGHARESPVVSHIRENKNHRRRKRSRRYPKEGGIVEAGRASGNYKEKELE